MLQTTRGIVFKYINYSETSIIAKIYTEEFGLLSFIIKGVRGKRSKTRLALFQPLTLLDIEVGFRENKNLQYLKEVKVAHAYTTLPVDTIKRTFLFFIDELLYRSIREEMPNKLLFNWLFDSLTWLDLTTMEITNFHLVFMVQFSRFLGFYPKKNVGEHLQVFDLREGQFTDHIPQHPDYAGGMQAELLDLLLETSFEKNNELEISYSERRNLLDVLITYFQLHLPGFGEMKSVEILHEVLG
ncbi:MAG: DNA repair protein RecO [Chlorobi bacterium]|nr:DNA repair protein RecO [Chlorobiota bacterium]